MAFLSLPITVRSPAILYLLTVGIRNYEFGLSSHQIFVTSYLIQA